MPPTLVSWGAFLTTLFLILFWLAKPLVLTTLKNIKIAHALQTLTTNKTPRKMITSGRFDIALAISKLQAVPIGHRVTGAYIHGSH